MGWSWTASPFGMPKDHDPGGPHVPPTQPGLLERAPTQRGEAGLGSGLF